MKIRHCLYLDQKVSGKLDALAARPGTNKSKIVNDAVADFLRRQGGNEFEAIFGPRLDKMSDQLLRLERNQEVVVESIALFVHYHLGITTPLPPAQHAEAQAVAQERFDTFLNQITRRIRQGKTIGREVLARLERPDVQQAGNA
ncbi:MAG TPA: hypothetical protein VIJ62_07745 [Rhizomicrobium sp.]